MMGIHARLLLDGALILLGLTAGCGKGSTEAPAPSAATRASERPSATIPVAASAPSASQPAARQPGVLLVDCNPGRFQRELPELTEAFNALPPGGTMEAELYGNFPGEFTEFMWVGELEIEAGLVAVKAPIVGEILYGSGGRILFPYDNVSEALAHSFPIVSYPSETVDGIKRLKLREGNILPMEKLAMMGISLHKHQAYFDFGTLKAADATPLPEEFRSGYRYYTYLGGGSKGYLLELRKSLDFRGKAVRFTVTRSL